MHISSRDSNERKSRHLNAWYWCRERNDGLYQVITYLCYKMLEELVLAILISVVIACIVFYGVQLKGQWVAFWLTYLVTLSCGVGAQLCPRTNLPLHSSLVVSNVATRPCHVRKSMPRMCDFSHATQLVRSTARSLN